MIDGKTVLLELNLQYGILYHFYYSTNLEHLQLCYMEIFSFTVVPVSAKYLILLDGNKFLVIFKYMFNQFNLLNLINS